MRPFADKYPRGPDLPEKPPAASVTEMSKYQVPPSVGVPLIEPLAVLRVSPAGKAPFENAQVNGAVPPEIPMVWL